MNDTNNIIIPFDSDSIKGKDKDEISEQLAEVGFTNVSMRKSSEKAGLFNKKNTIEHIVVGSKVTFTTDDYFKNDIPITIYYYSK